MSDQVTVEALRTETSFEPSLFAERESSPPESSVRRAVDPNGTVSVRMFWPFARYLGNYERELSLLRDAGVELATFADPRARISKSLGRALVLASIEKSKDPALGLHAGECTEMSDFGPIEQITRHCPTLRDAILCSSRYTRLHDEDVQSVLVEEGSRAIVHIRNRDPHRPAFVNEFQVTSTLKRYGFYLHQDLAPLEVHMMHEVATRPEEYQRVFRCPVRLGTEQNAIVLPRTVLDARATRANTNLFPVFEEQARRLLSDLDRDATFARRVRRLLEERLETKRVGITDVARDLHVSEATLRRRLSEENTTHKELLDGLRRERALSHVAAHRESLAEIGFLLGFSTPSAFGRAFRRWAGTSPTRYRERLGRS